MWNMHERILDDLPRTNNSLEGWHNHMLANVNCYHPIIWKFLQILKREQALNEVKIIQKLAGQEPSPKKRKYEDCTKAD